jgi:signal recognition particle subunit SRP68
MTTDGTPEDALQPIFHLELHAWLEAQQTAHGVRHNDDYGQYHAYCTRRLKRLSHLKDAKKYLVCSSKYASEKSGKGGRHAFCSRQTDTFDNTDNTTVPVQHVNVLWYLVVLCERAWAHANQLQKQGKRRTLVLGKLKKAQQWATLLLQMAKESTDEVTYQEFQAYASWMRANYALESLEYQVRRDRR